MSKQSGLGDALYVAGYDLSGDIQAVNQVRGGPAVFEVTGIDKSAIERIGGERDGAIEVTSFFNKATGRAHPRFSSLPTADIGVTYCRSTVLGAPAAFEVAKQVDYAPTRAADGSLTAAVAAPSTTYGLNWGVQLTAGTRTDTAATNGTSVDTTASASFGGQALLHVTAFTGTDVTVKIQDSADNVSFSDVTGFGFTQITSSTPSWERIALGATDTIRRYVRAVTVTTGGVTSVSFQVAMCKNTTETVF